MGHRSVEVNLSARTPAELEGLFSSQSLPMRIDLPRREAPCRTHLRSITLDSVSVCHYEGDGFRIGRHNHSHIPPHGPGYVQLVVPRSASVTLDQDGRHAELGPGSFALLSTERPFQAALSAERETARFSNIQVVVPVSLLRSRVPALDVYCARRVSLRPGIGRMMMDHIDSILANGSDLSGAEAGSIQDALVDVVAGVLASAPELADCDPCKVSPGHLVLGLARSYIESRLADPELSLRDVARHCHVSIRCLHAAFAATPVSVAGYVRERRLLHSRRALRDPALIARPVSLIAYDWGFTSGAHFSRIYKARFGVTPSGERELAGTPSLNGTQVRAAAGQAS